MSEAFAYRILTITVPFWEALVETDHLPEIKKEKYIASQIEHIFLRKYPEELNSNRRDFLIEILKIRINKKLLNVFV